MTIIQLHRATQVQDCECHRADFNCDQGRRCPERDGASACSELLEDDAAMERRYRLSSWFWSIYMVVLLVAVCAGIAHFLPVLKSLASN